MIATTAGRQERRADVALAVVLAGWVGGRYVPRQGGTVAAVLREHELDGVLVVADGQPVWRDAAGGAFSYHPNMAVGRLRGARRPGWHDTLVEALDLQPGGSVLDCTLGLGADALVASYAVGPRGLVVGLEASLVIAALVRHGLATYHHALAPAMRRIRVIAAHSDTAWQTEALAAVTWDAVVFDPMFDRPVAESHGLDGLRRLACYDQPSADVILTARHHARRVAVKGRPGDAWFEALDAERRVMAGRGRVAWAVFESG